MTAKRKAEIQRKLSLRSVPRPPDDLLDRIKGDIPHYLKVEAEREKFARMTSFHLKIAASILLVVTSLLGVLFLSSPTEMQKGAALGVPTRSAAPAPQFSVQAASPPSTAAASPALDTVEVEIAEETAATAADAASPRPAPQMFAYAEPQRRDVSRSSDLAFRDVDREAMSNATIVEGVEGFVEGGVADGTVGGVVGGVVGGTVSAPAMVAETAPPPPPAAVAPAPVPTTGAFGTSQQRSAQTITVTGEAPQLVPNAYAAELNLAPKSVFGLSIDPDVFRRIKTTIERGGRVTPANVNVEALVNYFAGTPDRRVRRGVRMEAEGSPAPVEAEGHRGILRVTIDTASINVAAGGSVPPIATDAKLDIEFNPSAVAEFRPIGDNFASTPESVLLHNLSVTGLYALDLNAPLKARDVVATIRLQYRDATTNRKQSITRVVHGSDFAKQWTSSSRRHRLASLGALWGESLRSTQGGTAVARRAEELASDEPDSERARELAAVATASSGGSR